VSSKQATNNPGLYCVKGQYSSLSRQTRVQNQFLSLSLNTDKTLPHCHMLFFHPAFYLSSCFLPRNTQAQLRSSRLVNGSLSYELIGSFISTYPRMSGDLEQSHRMPAGLVIQRLMVLLYIVLAASRVFTAT
jgi:hypothetical protein